MNIQFLGCGKMWEALLVSFIKSWCKVENIFVEDKNEKTKIHMKQKYNVHSWINRASDIIVLWIKPQQLKDIDFSIFNANSTILSILWWVTIDTLKGVSQKENIVRSLPNLPITIGEWIILYKTSWNIKENILWIIQNAFKSGWYFVELQDEKDIDKLSIISGAWPAYFSYITEKLIKKTKKMWFDNDIANKLAISTFIWSAKLLEKLNITPSEFRENVSSKWWVTQEVIDTRENWNFEEIFFEWLDNGIAKSKKLNDW